LKLSRTENIEHLLVGKTGVLDFAVISEMIERGFIPRPNSLFSLSTPQPEPMGVLDYLVNSIR